MEERFARSFISSERVARFLAVARLRHDRLKPARATKIRHDFVKFLSDFESYVADCVRVQRESLGAFRARWTHADRVYALSEDQGLDTMWLRMQEMVNRVDDSQLRGRTTILMLPTHESAYYSNGENHDQSFTMLI